MPEKSLDISRHLSLLSHITDTSSGHLNGTDYLIDSGNFPASVQFQCIKRSIANATVNHKDSGNSGDSIKFLTKKNEDSSSLSSQ